MATRKPRTVLYRRKREKKTNYPKRLRLLLSRKKRLVVRLTNQRIYAQLVEFNVKGDKVLVGVDSSSLKKFGWNYSCKNVPAAYLTGLMLGREAVKKGHKQAILDTGLKSPLHRSKIFAFLKGALDAGMEIPCGSDDVFPVDRLNGEHIKQFADKIKGEDAYSKRFAQYLKNKVEPAKIVDLFEQVKQKIES
jgi:large subunit ribosomal protein L18